jgi:hypothetical protein
MRSFITAGGREGSSIIILSVQPKKRGFTEPLAATSGCGDGEHMSAAENAGSQLPDEIRVGENVVDTNLRWHASWQEDGVPVEEDGIGFPPEQLRQRLIKESGEWETVVTSVPDKAKAAHALRRSLNLSLAEITERLRAMPGPVFRGTQVEAQWIAGHLRDVGCQCLVRRMSRGSKKV